MIAENRDKTKSILAIYIFVNKFSSIGIYSDKLVYKLMNLTQANLSKILNHRKLHFILKITHDTAIFIIY